MIRRYQNVWLVPVGLWWLTSRCSHVSAKVDQAQQYDTVMRRVYIDYFQTHLRIWRFPSLKASAKIRRENHTAEDFICSIRTMRRKYSEKKKKYIIPIKTNETGRGSTSVNILSWKGICASLQKYSYSFSYVLMREQIPILRLPNVWSDACYIRSCRRNLQTVDHKGKKIRRYTLHAKHDLQKKKKK